MYIYPNFLSVEQFHRVVWVQVDNGPWWYYTPQEVVYTLQTSKKFFDSVDKDIRNLVKFLHGRGYITTPSCAGHLRKPSHYAKVYSQLVKDQEKIRTEGVKITNVNQEVIQPSYQDSGYYIPWPSKEKFIKEALEEQTKGILGIIDPDKKIYKAAKANNITCVRDNNITLLMEYSREMSRKKEGWDRIGEVIVDAIV
mgnify:CR=1 FL=1